MKTSKTTPMNKSTKTTPRTSTKTPVTGAEDTRGPIPGRTPVSKSRIARPTNTPKEMSTTKTPSERIRPPRGALRDIEPPPNATPHKSSQINADLNVSVRAEQKFASFADLITKKNVRLLNVPRNGFVNFEGLCNFPNLRMIDLRNNPGEFPLISVLVAFRSLNMKTVNGEEVTEEHYNRAFQYSAVVTHALRKGMNPDISEDPEEALQDAIAFLTKDEKVEEERRHMETSKRLRAWTERRKKEMEDKERRSKIMDKSKSKIDDSELGVSALEDPDEEEEEHFEPIEIGYHVDDENVIKIDANAEIYSWYVMDDEFNWKPIAGEEDSLFNPLNSPVKCVLKNVHRRTETGTERTDLCLSVIVPERDRQYHVYGELTGNAVEGGILYVKAPLSTSIEWKHADDEELIESGTLILPIKPESVGRIIVCDIIPKVGNSMTRLFTNIVKPGEFRFKSLRLQGQLVENDEIEFEISTKGTKATFKGIRVLRSARHGEWENIDFISAEQSEGTNQLKYRLTVQDIGCVIRAVCITEGGGPPLMLTSSERVQPSAPHFVSANIYGSMKVGMPLFAIAQYEGGVQGNCRYEWSIGGSRGRPVVVPTDADVGQKVTCTMTPIRSDGSIGRSVIVEAPNSIEHAEKPMEERFLQFHKKTRSGKLQMSFVDRPASDQLFLVHEGETIIISTPCDWVVVDSQGIHPMGSSKTFTAESGHVKGIIVVFNEDFFALVGQIEAAQPTAADVAVTCDKSSAFLTVKYQYYGGVEGRSIVQWNRNDGRAETVAAFGRSFHLSLADRGCTYRAIVTPVSLEGKRGTPTSSEPFLIEDDCVTFDERPTVELIEPEAVLEDVPIEVRVVEPGTQIVEDRQIAIVQLTAEMTKRQIIVWRCKGKVIAQGQMSFTPTKNDIGKVFTVQLCDRLRDAVVCECDLPPVEAQDPRVENVRLTIEEIPGTRKRRVTVHGDYYGGIEGNSVMIWRAQTPEDKEPKEVARTNQKWVEIDESFEGAKIGVVYVPISTTQEAPGHSVESEMITIPVSKVTAQTIRVTSATIVPNAEYTTLTCVVKTKGRGKVTYNWGYVVGEDDKQFTEEYEKVHQITEDDFDYPLFCHVQPIAEDGTLAQEVFVYVDPPVQEMFTPKIVGAKIEPCVKNADPALTQGQELKVTLDYQGPPIQSTIVRWQRRVGDDWKTLLDAETYTTSINDVESRIRAIVAVQAISELLSEPVSSTEFVTGPVFISKTDPTVKRLASTMVRTGRAQFDACLPMGEPVSVCIENGQFLIKSGNSVLMKAPVSGVAVEALDYSPSTAAVRARHGYNTELTFKEKKMKGGMKFSAAQTRDLFVVTLRDVASKPK